jgi:hypothetical protein
VVATQAEPAATWVAAHEVTLVAAHVVLLAEAHEAAMPVVEPAVGSPAVAEADTSPAGAVVVVAAAEADGKPR